MAAISLFRFPGEVLTTAVADGQAAAEQEKAMPVDGRQKLDSHLLLAIEKARTGKIEGAPQLEPDVDVVNGRVLVDVTGDVSETLSVRIVELGGQVVSSAAAYHTTRAWMPVLQLEILAQRADVRFVEPAAKGTTNAPIR